MMVCADLHSLISRIRTLYQKPLSSMALTGFMLPRQEAMSSLMVVVYLVTDLGAGMVAAVAVVVDFVTTASRSALYF